MERGKVALTMFKKKYVTRVLSTPDQNKRLVNGFLLAEALLALLICMISGYLLLESIATLSRAMQLSVQPTMESSDD